MAKKKKTKTAKPGGPYLAAACFCETLLMGEDDKAPSAIRIVDTFTIVVSHDAPADLPSEKNRLPIHATGLISFKGSNVPGNYKIALRLVPPSGKSQLIRE